MRIQQISLKNYRQFRDQTISFDRPAKKDLWAIVGLMGTGKTNLLNAIGWCLYGDEPLSSEKSKGLPLLNLAAHEEGEVGHRQSVEVEVVGETDTGENVTFVRRASYRKGKGKSLPLLEGVDFEVEIPSSKGSRLVSESDDPPASAFVERFVPKAIRDHFFLTGERLDRYFRDTLGQSIKHEVFVISQIDLLEKVHGRIDKIISEFRREAGQKIPGIENTTEALANCKKDFQEKDKQIENCKGQIAKADLRIKQIQEELTGSPDIEKLENKRNELLQRQNIKEQGRNDKLKEKGELLFDYGKILLSQKATQRSLQAIDQMRKDRKIPPTHDSDLLKRVRREKFCHLCGRPLDEKSTQRVKNLIDDVLPGGASKAIDRMEPRLRQLTEKLNSFGSSMKRVTREIKGYEDDLAEIDKEVAGIDSKLSGYNRDKIRRLHGERISLEDTRQHNTRLQGRLELNKEQLASQIKTLEEQERKQMIREGRHRKLRERMDFCNTAMNVLKETREDIMSDIRKKIADETKRRFFGLHWKKSSYSNITIDEDYRVDLLDRSGLPAFGTISQGEMEILTLAFTLALHEVSGFDSPIIVDRPLAMVSGPPRRKIVNVFSKISEKKQIILLFTPDDYSSDISEILNSQTSGRLRLVMSPDERETTAEGF